MTREPVDSGDKPVEEIAADAERRNPDETTRREAIELELEDEDRSDEGEEIGDVMP